MSLLGQHVLFHRENLLRLVSRVPGENALDGVKRPERISVADLAPMRDLVSPVLHLMKPTKFLARQHITKDLRSIVEDDSNLCRRIGRKVLPGIRLGPVATHRRSTSHSVIDDWPHTLGKSVERPADSFLIAHRHEGSSRSEKGRGIRWGLCGERHEVRPLSGEVVVGAGLLTPTITVCDFIQSISEISSCLAMTSHQPQ